MRADDHHGKGGVQVGQEGDGGVDHGGQPPAGDKERKGDEKGHHAGVEDGVFQGKGIPAAHEDDAVDPVADGEDGQHEDHEENGALTQDGLDEGNAHKAQVAVDRAELEHRAGLLGLLAEGGQGQENIEEIKPHRSRGAEQHRMGEGRVPVHLEGLNDDTGGHQIEQQIGAFCHAVLGEFFLFGQEKAHAHQQKQGDHLRKHNKNTIQHGKHSYYNKFGQESRAASPAFPPSRA